MRRRGVRRMANAFIIEINGKAAGLVVEEKGGFRFFASHRIFWKLDGQVYRRVREAEEAAKVIWNQSVGATSVRHSHLGSDRSTTSVPS